MCDGLFLVEKATIIEFNSQWPRGAIRPSFLSLRLNVTGLRLRRYILNCQLRTAPASSSRGDAFYINMLEKWISRLMIWSWGMTSAKESIFPLLKKKKKKKKSVSLKRYYAHLNFRDRIFGGRRYRRVRLKYDGCFSDLRGGKKKKGKTMLFVEVWKASVLAAVTGKGVSEIIASCSDCTHPPRLLRRAGDD